MEEQKPKKDRDGYVIAELYVFDQFCPECQKQIKCRMFSFDSGGYLCVRYRFKCPNGHLFVKELETN